MVLHDDDVNRSFLMDCQPIKSYVLMIYTSGFIQPSYINCQNYIPKAFEADTRYNQVTVHPHC